MPAKTHRIVWPISTKIGDQHDDNKRSSELVNDKNQDIWSCCHLVLKNRHLLHGETEKLQNILLWRRGKLHTSARAIRESMSERNRSHMDHWKNKTGRQPNYSPQWLKNSLKQFPIKKRKTMRDTAKALGISVATFHHSTVKKKYSILFQLQRGQSWLLLIGQRDQNLWIGKSVTMGITQTNSTKYTLMRNGST